MINGLIDTLQPPIWLFDDPSGIGYRAIIGAVGGAAIAWVSVRHRALSKRGAIAAAVMGMGYTAFGGLVWMGTLLAFFMTSSLLSKWKRKQHRKAAAESLYEKTGARDASQVWANGGIGLALCIGNALFPHIGWLYAFVGVMAAVNGDTWATELGSLSRKPPVSIRTGKRVPPGTSGGITAAGSLAAAAGSLLIGLAAACLMLVGSAWQGYGGWTDLPIFSVIVAALFGGIAGTFFDSLLGAYAQVMFRCSVCGSETERSIHCDAASQPLRGWRIMDNDAVNIVSSFVGGVIAWGISQ
ncbi:uncharacterized protein (TIGR00297 family) [Paenibacillus cellulosilyticus]|uniref:Uncharacterized protein (TIGR00297 family) n=1 Tax=Paenibacillus cellulosilyticus TaxID=375489 RepID=A0A2V2YRC1_9BACL|nr:DUF92 domain-containing protein [Paenibacillus cellulosilyticus]PWV99686.1 uncharacterized protein (TIGR00297 family) [Paenibacillus cellulosilyticus]QKS44878.1 DUF92 domain-containing protein [Paenibacillus cellulosilyticus]